MNYLIIHNVNERFIFSNQHDIVLNNLTKEFILGFSDFTISSKKKKKKKKIFLLVSHFKLLWFQHSTFPYIFFFLSSKI